MRKTYTELKNEIENKLCILQAKHGTAQSDAIILNLVVNDIITNYCTGQYIINNKI